MVLVWNLHLVVLLLLGLEFASSCTAVACVDKALSTHGKLALPDHLGVLSCMSALSTQLGSSTGIQFVLWLMLPFRYYSPEPGASGRNEVKRHVHMFSSYKKLVGSCAAICYMAIWVGYTDMHLIFGVSMTLERVAQQGELNNQLKL
ncbi:hypothetical protein ACSBR2_036495 [Camellia fascicularis]